jgi:hypothetical protein
MSNVKMRPLSLPPLIAPIRGHQEANVADIERGKTSGELASDVDAELIIDAVFGAIFYRLFVPDVTAD